MAVAALRGAARAARRGAVAVRRMPNPRLTGLGGGLFASASMLLLAALDRLLLGGSFTVYGVLFVLVSMVTALWVRPAELITAPIVVPLAFAIGLLPIADGSGGFGGQVMGLLTSLAMHAGWLYGGTLIAALVVAVRKVRIVITARRRRARARQAAASAASAAAARPVGRRTGL
ncbi:DUF6542 domain-containing protein [Streptomyces apocyni]|uniref:DUF6542 domain-containing protein n=1 Tax=Streptomyces apocyni TaxID=2654677 RepID=UPI002D7FBE4C|nr:DUF6542 domain-containing protein [Streptomyces apocyni]